MFSTRFGRYFYYLYFCGSFSRDCTRRIVRLRNVDEIQLTSAFVWRWGNAPRFLVVRPFLFADLAALLYFLIQIELEAVYLFPVFGINRVTFVEVGVQC